MSAPASIYHRLRKRIGPRRFQIYAVGPGKSGTNSLANLFQPNYRSAHEMEPAKALRTLIDYRNGEVSDRQVRTYLAARDRRHRLEMDSAGYNAYFARFLVEMFPRAKYILSVRDCFSWANSAINQVLNNPSPQGHWREWRRALFGEHRDDDFQAEEATLRDNGLWPLARTFSAWAEAYRSALDAVPADRMLIVEIREIGDRLDDIASFAGIPARTLSAGKSRSYRAPKDHGLLTNMDRDFVDATAQKVCGDLMAKLYPGTACELERFMRG